MLVGVGLSVAGAAFFGIRQDGRETAIAPPTGVPGAAVPGPQPASAVHAASPQWGRDGQPIARDPSIDPQAFARAYPKRPQAFPAEARPKASAIDPPKREWNRIKRQDRPVVY